MDLGRVLAAAVSLGLILISARLVGGAPEMVLRPFRIPVDGAWPRGVGDGDALAGATRPYPARSSAPAPALEISSPPGFTPPAPGAAAPGTFPPARVHGHVTAR